MIENFTPQPYPLEASHGDTWQLVIGWERNTGGDIVPLVALESGLTRLADPLEAPRRYRLADSRPVAPRPTASASSRVDPPIAAPRRPRGA